MKFIIKNEKITDILLDKKEEILLSDAYKLLAKIAELMAEAFNECKDTRGLISQKGYNCERMLL